jgi:hypothetical protein
VKATGKRKVRARRPEGCADARCGLLAELRDRTTQVRSAL